MRGNLHSDDYIFAMKSLLVLLICALTSSAALLEHSVRQEATTTEKDVHVQKNWFYNIPEEVKFYLYTRSNPTEALLLDTIESIKASPYDKTKPTKFVTHGFQSSGFSDTCLGIKSAYLEHMDVNVIIVDWQNIAKNIFYFIPAASTLEIGQYYASFMDILIEYGTDPMKIHLIGHSLGAHVSGFAGIFLKSKIGRITGLDPAYPSFGVLQLVGARLSKDQANFVDIIHTSAGTLGLKDPIGHADFYPNGGKLPQPGCGGVEEVMQSCSHGRSWQYFKESINPNIKFLAYKSKSYEDYLSKNFESRSESMGEYVSQDVRGVFYLTTKPEAPFATGN